MEEKAGATDSPSPRLRVVLWAALVYLAQWLMITETTRSFLLFYRKVSREASFAYSDSEKAACWAARTGCLSGTSQSNLSSCLQQPIYNSTEMTHGIHQVYPPNTQKGAFHTHHKASNTIAPSPPPSSEDDLQELQAAEWITAGFDETHQQEPLLLHGHTRIHLLQDDTRPKGLNTSVLEHLWTMVSTITIFLRNKLFAATPRWSVAFRIFVWWLPMLKTPRMKSVKAQPISVR